MAVQTQIQARRGTAATWTSTNPTLAAGETGFETDTGKFKIGNGSTAWAALAYSAGATAVTYLFNATAGQTTFSGADANALTLAYTVGAEQVYLNGALQVRGSDYTASNGTSIVLTSGALVSDVLNVIAYSAMTITDTYTQAQADAKFIQAANTPNPSNPVLNSAFQIAQRGTSFVSSAITNGGNSYTLDRWNTWRGAFAAGATFSRQETADTTNLPNIQYCLRLSRDNGNTSVATLNVGQNMESANAIPFAGKTITFSFYARAGATYSATSSALSVNLRSGTGTDQNWLNGYTGDASVLTGTATLTTTWQRFTFTGTVAATAKELFPYLTFTPVGTAGASDYMEVTGVQIEVGSVATPFRTNGGTIGGELQACKRYYWNFSSLNSSVTNFTIGSIDSTTAAKFVIPMPVTMRTNPSFSVTGTASFAVKSAGTNKIPSAINLDQANVDSVSINAVSTGYVAGDAATLFANGSTGCSLQFSAEL